MTQSVPLFDAAEENREFEAELERVAAQVIRDGKYIIGPDVPALESEVAHFVGAQFALGVSSGTDALLVALMAMNIGPGDEVITTPFTFFATVGAIARVGAKPVFVDIDPVTFNLDMALVEKAVTPRTKAVIPVHLFGQACDMKAMMDIAKRHKLLVIEDCAQAMGATFDGKQVGAIGDVGCFSFFPSKNLGGFGDGGAVTTNNAELADRMRAMRGHGSKQKYYHTMVGGNFRIDTLQAALLRVKFPKLAGWIAQRRQNAETYNKAFAKFSSKSLQTPQEVHGQHSYNQYVVRSDRRDALADKLKQDGITTAVYYPSSLHVQPCFESLGYKKGSFPVSEQACNEVLALPIFPGLGAERQKRVIDSVASFLS